MSEQLKFESRLQVQDKYKWDLSPIYNSQDDWENDYKLLQSKLNQYDNFKGKVGESAEKLFECLHFDEQLSIICDRLYLFAFLNKDIDLSKSEGQEIYGKIQTLASQLSEVSSFIRPEILSIGKEKLITWSNESAKLADYKFMFENMLRQAEHSLSPAEERIIALSGNMSSTSYNAFSLLKNTDMDFETIKDENGEELKLSDSRFYAALYSPDRNYRQRAYQNYYKSYIGKKNTIATLLNGSINSYIFNAKARNYSSTRQAALEANNIPINVYDNLVNTLNTNTEPLRRWANIKKRLLGVDTLHPFDTYVSIFKGSGRKYTYDEATEITIKALQPLGDDYLAHLKEAYDNRRIDVYETPSKRSGAYSSGTTFGQKPYVLLNWQGMLNDVSTLAHEMGHNMHSLLTGMNQKYPYADYSIFLAEVASITNEALLHDYLIDTLESKEDKLLLLESNLNQYLTTFYRQTQFAEFEQTIHHYVESGMPLTSDYLCQTYEAIFKKYWGDSLNADMEESYTWARVPHFHYGFYVYQYATGLAAGEEFARRIKLMGKEAADMYLEFLKAGKSDYPINVLKKAGVDMSKPDTINNAVANMNKTLDEIEKLI